MLYILIDHGQRPITVRIIFTTLQKQKYSCANDIWNKSYRNCGNEMKMKKWSSQWTQFMQFRKEAWKKFRTSTGFEHVTSRYRCNAPPTELWNHWRWEQVNCGFICSRERMSVNVISEINHIGTAEMKWRWRNDRRSERNLCNFVKKPEKNPGLQRGLNPWPCDTCAMLYQLSYEATDVESRSFSFHFPPKRLS